MNSVEKVQALTTAMLRTEDELDGLLGLVQGAVAMEKAGIGGVNLTAGLPDDPAELDEQLLGVLGFILWLRSDDAPTIDLGELGNNMPAAIGQLIGEAGLLT